MISQETAFSQQLTLIFSFTSIPNKLNQSVFNTICLSINNYLFLFIEIGTLKFQLYMRKGHILV